MTTRPIAHPKINRTELAGRIGIDRTYITKILNGTREASLNVAIAIFEETGVRLGPIKHATPQDIRAMSRALGAGV